MSNDPFYLSPEWRKVRRRVLRRDPMCIECHEALSCRVDHIKPKRMFPELALDEDNLRGMCEPCHNKRSAQQYNHHASPVGEDGQPTDPSHPWNAGEQTRISFRGPQRTPQPWQMPALRLAASNPSPVTSAPARPGAGRRAAQASPEPAAMPLALPPARRR
jgi:5-methylcytosine-specific restriction protein A